jgi:hypothetical protein
MCAPSPGCAASFPTEPSISRLRLRGISTPDRGRKQILLGEGTSACHVLPHKVAKHLRSGPAFRSANFYKLVPQVSLDPETQSRIFSFQAHGKVYPMDTHLYIHVIGPPAQQDREAVKNRQDPKAWTWMSTEPVWSAKRACIS